jgi:Bacteriophage tail sheath protein
MPSALTYPGVYVEEIPSGVRTITGVSTSIAAFVGRARRGETNKATTITSWADYERRFGGLDSDYPMSFSVRDFFQNGGSQAIVVRAYAGDVAKVATWDVIPLIATSPGTWANNVRVRIDQDGVTDKTKYYNVTIHDKVAKTTETYSNVSIEDNALRVDRVLAGANSMLKYVLSGGAPTLPATFNDKINAGDDVWAEAPTNKLSSGVKTKAADDDKDMWKDKKPGSESESTGLFALNQADLFNLLIIPPDTRDGTLPNEIYQAALEYCRKRRALLIVDPPDGWKGTDLSTVKPDDLKLTGDSARNAAVYFPRVMATDTDGTIKSFTPSGMIAGIMARTDVSRGVWKAPAGIDAALSGAQALQYKLDDRQNGLLNPIGVNVLRTFPIHGNIVWGARTMRGADASADEYKYVPVRRLALFIEESLYRGLQWVVFEPNDEPLWAQIRLNAGAFMNGLFRQGAFQGVSAREAYFVKCDKDTTTPNDVNLGIVNILVGFAPLKPAEFVVIKLQQIAGQIQT